MTWAKLDDGFPAHRKVRGLSDAAFRLHVTALCDCAAHLTDGAITAPAGFVVIDVWTGTGEERSR